MAFVLRGWQPHIEERPEAFDFNAFPRERSLVKFHLSEFRIWKAFWPWGNRGSVACQLLRMKTSTTFPQPQVASQHLDGAWTRRLSPLPTAMLVWYGEQPQGITPLAWSWGRTQDLPHGKPVTWPLGHRVNLKNFGKKKKKKKNAHVCCSLQSTECEILLWLAHQSFLT